MENQHLLLGDDLEQKHQHHHHLQIEPIRGFWCYVELGKVPTASLGSWAALPTSSRHQHRTVLRRHLDFRQHMISKVPFIEMSREPPLTSAALLIGEGTAGAAGAAEEVGAS